MHKFKTSNLNFNVTRSFPFDAGLFETAGTILSGKMYSIFALLWQIYGYIETAHQQGTFLQNFCVDLKYGLAANLGFDGFAKSMYKIGFFLLKAWSKTHRQQSSP